MHEINLSFVAMTAIIAMMIAQGCVSTAGTAASTPWAKPTQPFSDATAATTSVTVKIATRTPGAYLRYTLDGFTPTGGLSRNGKEIQVVSGKISIVVGWREKTLKAIA